MFTVDEIVKLILGISVAFSIVVVAYQIARLLSEAANVVKDIRKPIQDVGEITDLAVEDYKKIRKVIDFVANIKDSFSSLKGFMSLFNREDDEDSIEIESE